MFHNAGRLALAVVLALTVSACAVFEGQQSTGQYVDDATITSRVKARFIEDANVSAMRLGVETMKGTVQLSGFATSSNERSRAADIARNVPGVTSVRNDIVVRPASK